MLLPIAKRILVQPEESKSEKLIIIKGLKPTRFNVIAIGDEVTKVKVNDVVFLDKYAGTEIEHDQQKYFVIEENSILAKLDL